MDNTPQPNQTETATGTDSESRSQDGHSSNSSLNTRGNHRVANVNRRELLTAVNITAAVALAGCAQVGDLLPEDGNNDDNDENPENTADVGINDALAAHIEYRENTVIPSTATGLKYEALHIEEERNGDIVQLTAEPTSDQTGDRILILLPATESVDEVALTFVARWGAPVDEDLRTTTLFDRDITFTGGSGHDIAVAAGTETIDEDTAAIFAVRGESVADIESLIEDFDEHISDPTG